MLEHALAPSVGADRPRREPFEDAATVLRVKAAVRAANGVLWNDVPLVVLLEPFERVAVFLFGNLCGIGPGGRRRGADICDSLCLWLGRGALGGFAVAAKVHHRQERSERNCGAKGGPHDDPAG